VLQYVLQRVLRSQDNRARTDPMHHSKKKSYLRASSANMPVESWYLTFPPDHYDRVDREIIESFSLVMIESCVAVCCSVLQCVAVCCSVLQCVAVI